MVEIFSILHVLARNKNLGIPISLDIRQSYTDSFSRSTVESERGRETEVKTYRQKEAQSR